MALQSLSFDFALMDLNLPDGASLELLRNEKIPSNTLTILMTAEGGIKSAVEAMRLGAADYLSKPFDTEEISILLLKAEQQRKNQRLIQHSLEKRRQKTANLYFEGSFAEDLAQLTKITEVDQRLATDLPPILIDGPTGSGKSTYAKWIHDHGPRQDAPFVAINCSAIPDNLIESELFGHEKGAFTDAKMPVSDFSKQPIREPFSLMRLPVFLWQLKPSSYLPLRAKSFVELVEPKKSG